MTRRFGLSQLSDHNHSNNLDIDDNKVTKEQNLLDSYSNLTKDKNNLIDKRLITKLELERNFTKQLRCCRSLIISKFLPERPRAEENLTIQNLIQYAGVLEQ